MKKMSIFLFLLAVLSVTSFTVANEWKNDKAHSKLTFSIIHLGISEVTGLFKDFDVTVNGTKPDFSDAVFELVADVASVDTEVEKRDNHLRSADFFDVAKYPKMTFKSTSIQSVGSNKFKLTGDLTLHGITKSVTMDLRHNGTIEHPSSKKPLAGFQLTGTIKRSDFGIGEKFTPPMLSDEVGIKADGEFAQK
jgi:polyisoprenoid-binding protein YceI